MLNTSTTLSFPAWLNHDDQPLPPIRPSRLARGDHGPLDQTVSADQLAIIGLADEARAVPGLDDPCTVPEWTEQAIVELHWVLLRQLDNLRDPETPLEEKLDTLAWALTDPCRDNRPFSFANCIRVVGTSPLSPTPYFGRISVEDIRDWLRVHARHWIRQTIARYPEWVQQLIRDQPDLVARELSANPQWINEQIRRRLQSQQADLFEPGTGLPN